MVTLVIKSTRKPFVVFFQNEMVFKLNGDIHQEAISIDGSKLFDPSGNGRAMKAWVQVPCDYKDQWKVFAEEAASFVLSNS